MYELPRCPGVSECNVRSDCVSIGPCGTAAPKTPQEIRSYHQWGKTRELIAGKLPYEVKPAPMQSRPFLGYEDPMNDPRVTFVAEMSYGRLVRQRGRL